MIFPPIESALEEPNGLLAMGGDLSTQRLLLAYASGIFPWFDEQQPILWWSPNPRAVIYPSELKIAKSLRSILKKGLFHVTYDTAFSQVVEACRAPRKNAQGTWITEQIQKSYNELHQQGYAHSIECWQKNKLVGGLYGVTLGKLFFGESMFSFATNSSKVAFVYLVQHLASFGFPLIDCQVPNSHLESLGSTTIPRSEFKILLKHYASFPRDDAPWHTPFSLFFD